MSDRPSSPLLEAEALLAAPAATGIFLTRIASDSPLLEHGAAVGDIVTAVDGDPVPDLRAWIEALQGRPGDPRALTVRRVDGSTATWTVTPPVRVSQCVVKEGSPAWTPVPDSDHEPEFSGLADGTEIWLRNRFGDEPAGFERVLVRHDGDLLRIDTLFRIGDDHPEHGKWDYRTRGRSAHRFDRFLSTVETAFWEGSPGEETFHGEVTLAEDGVWRGRHGETPAEIESPSVNAVTPYTMMLLPLTMPLTTGASITVAVAGEGTGLISSRGRMACHGREEVVVDGEALSAWRFEWHHWGEVEQNERFWVDDGRRLVRIDWGPGYNHCVAELVDADRVLDGVAPHVTVE